LHEVISMLWVHEIQPAAWLMSLMQPIYKVVTNLRLAQPHIVAYA